MSKRQELIDRIMALTPEQLKKFLEHPEFVKIMKEEKQNETRIH